MVDVRSLTRGRTALPPEGKLRVRRDSEDAFEPVATPNHARARRLGWSDLGLIEAFGAMVSDARRQRLLEVLDGRLTSVTVLLDAPHDPHNGAAILRTCEALGIQSVHVLPRVEEFLASRVITKGSEQWVDIVRHASVDSALRSLKALDYVLVGSHPQGELLPSALREIPRVAIVLGNEHAGICDELERGVERKVRVPMRGFVESLNLSVSAAVLLAQATQGRSGDLSPEQRNCIHARWLLQSVARSGEILEGLPPR